MLKFEIHHLKQCSSTNEEAKNFPPYHAIIAETQIAGKGRNGRKWESFSGNLFLLTFFHRIGFTAQNKRGMPNEHPPFVLK